MIRRLLAYPIGQSRRLDALLIGSGLHLLAVWIPVLPLVAVAGYLSRVVAATTTARRRRTDPALPAWRPIRPLFRDGVRLCVAATAYLVVPVGLLVVTLGGPLERLGPTGGSDGLVFVAGSTVATLLAFALLYPMPAAVVAVAHEGSLRAAVDTTRIGRATRDAGYLVTTLLTAGGVGLAAAAYRPLNVIAVGFVLAFYVEVVVAAALGGAVARAWERQAT